MFTINDQQSVNELIAEQLHIEVGDIAPQKKLVADLGADSLDAVEIVLGLEEKFDITVPDEDVEKLVTVQDLYNYIEKRLK